MYAAITYRANRFYCGTDTATDIAVDGAGYAYVTGFHLLQDSQWQNGYKSLHDQSTLDSDAYVCQS